MRPPFIRAIPDEVDRYGAPAALVLAHIRFRCESDGNDRFTVDGVRWWRVSNTDLGIEVGLSRQSVRTALSALSGVVSAKTFPRWDAVARTIDQTRAYSVSTCEGLESTAPDVRMVDSNQDRVEINHPPGWNQPGTGLKSTNVPSIETLKTKAGEGGEASPQLAAARLAVPGRSEHPPQTISATVHSEPPRYCPAHPGGTRSPCGPCKFARLDWETWHEQQAPNKTAHKMRAWAELAAEERVHEAAAAAATARMDARRRCRTCSGTGFVDIGPDLVGRCPDCADDRLQVGAE